MSDAPDRGLAVCIGATGVWTSSGAGTGARRVGARPPAALTPRVRGERPECADAESGPLGQELSVLGSGLDWPPAARIGDRTGVARLPAAYAWHLLHTPERAWEWSGGDHPVRISPADALAAIVDGVMGRGAPRGQPVAVVVPNTIGMTGQERLISGLRRSGVRPVLLWRPVAAALAWIDRFGEQVSQDRAPSDIPVARVASLHLGIDGIEADVLDLVIREWEGQRWVLPARKRPEIQPCDEWSLAAAEWAAGSLSAGLGRAWHRLWCQPWSEELSARMGRFTAAGEPGVLTRWRRTYAWGFRPDHDHGTPDTASLAAWLTEFFGSLGVGDCPLAGAVITGELAATAGLDGLSARAEAEFHRLHPVATVLSAEDPHEAGGLLAEGAGLFLGRYLAGQPTYLDTLPSIEVVVIRDGEPAWEPLIDQQDRYVLGARIHTYETGASRFRIRADERKLTLSVMQEGYPSAREVKEDLQADLKEDVPVRLRIEIGAGQGNPKVEILPVRAGDLLGQRIYLDWDKARDTGQSREEVLKSIPKTYPPLEPRHSSRDRWEGRDLHYPVSEIMREAVTRMRSQASQTLLAPRLASLRRALWTRDDDMRHQEPPEHGTAFGSSGLLPALSAGSELADEFVELAEASLREGAVEVVICEILRCLGYMSCDSEFLSQYLRSQISRGFAGSSTPKVQASLIAIGNCVRDTATIAEFVGLMHEHIDDALPGGRLNWMRALCQMLRYREEATAEADSQICDELAWFCYQVARGQIEAKQEAAYLYRYGTLCIAFMLRRRRYDESFMDPQGDRCRVIKGFLSEVADGLDAGDIHKIDGVVDPADVTRKIIDYIDKRGTGRIIVGE